MTQRSFGNSALGIIVIAVIAVVIAALFSVRFVDVGEVGVGGGVHLFPVVYLFAGHDEHMSGRHRVDGEEGDGGDSGEEGGEGGGSAEKAPR